jgi:hypothetical protein
MYINNGTKQLDGFPFDQLEEMGEGHLIFERDRDIKSSLSLFLQGVYINVHGE